MVQIVESVVVDQAELLELRTMTTVPCDLVELHDTQIENVSSVDGRVELVSYDNLGPEAEFTPFQAMLCPPVITGLFEGYQMENSLSEQVNAYKMEQSCI